MTTVTKFGGTSLATGARIRAVAAILAGDKTRTICVVSAPGKIPDGMKLTDLLIHDHLTACAERVTKIVYELGLDCSVLQVILARLKKLHRNGFAPARIAFGEWLSAYLLAEVTGWRFIDASQVVFFAGDQVWINMCWKADEHVIIPGFYGYDLDNECVRTFPRGGSDITASLIAAKVGATLCENWTDVPGVFDQDPNRHRDAIHYPTLSYAELLAVAHAGAEVFHLAAVAPLMQSGIPLHIRSTFTPDVTGTIVT